MFGKKLTFKPPDTKMHAFSFGIETIFFPHAAPVHESFTYTSGCIVIPFMYKIITSTSVRRLMADI